MDRDLVYTLRLRRRLLALAIAGVLGVVGLAWLLSAALPPHTASIVLELEEDVSTGAEWFPPNAPRNFLYPEDPFDRAVWPVASPIYDEEIADRLVARFPRSTVTAESIRDRIDVDADFAEHRITIELRDDRRDVARGGISVIVAVYEQHLDSKRSEAAQRQIPHWVISAQSPVTLTEVDPIVVALYLVGLAVVLLAIPGRWWTEPVEWDEFEREQWWLLAVGVFGLLLSLTPEVVGAGWPGFGALQTAGAFFSAVVIGLALIVHATESVGIEPVRLERGPLLDVLRRSTPVPDWTIPVPGWWPSRRAAAAGTGGLLLLIGVVLVAVIASRPSYRATAEVVVAWQKPPVAEGAVGPDLKREQEIFESDRLAGLVVSFAEAIDCGAPCELEAASVQESLVVETNDKPGGLSVHFFADDPERAQIGANMAVEAYRVLLEEDPNRADTPQRCGLSLPLTCPAGTQIALAWVTDAALPDRQRRPVGEDVVTFLSLSTLAVLAVWSLWPERDPSLLAEPAGRDTP